MRILVVDDQAAWRTAVKEALEPLNGKVDLAETYAEALRFVGAQRYDLAVVDLGLLGDLTSTIFSDKRGVELIVKMRGGSQHPECAIIALTGYPRTLEVVQDLIRRHVVHVVVEKTDFDDERLLSNARRSLREARLTSARMEVQRTSRFTLLFNEDGLVGSKLSAPRARSAYPAGLPRPVPAEWRQLAVRADYLNVFLLQGDSERWRQEVQFIGETMYESLAADNQILANLIAAPALADSFVSTWLRFSGPSQGLAIPFELLRRGGEPLCLKHIITRHVLLPSHHVSRKVESFSEFIEHLESDGRTLRILVVAADSDGGIPAVEREAEMLAQDIGAALNELDLAHEVTLLRGDQATFTNLQELLAEGRHHVLHFAGHGRYDSKMPEVSGLVLRHGSKLRTLSAADLSLLVDNTELRLVFLSCCLGARSAPQLKRGDFHGILEALVKADIPTIIGYRWVVSDEMALLMASAFYRCLWRTFSPGEALLAARRACATGERGRDDETWAAPVLLMQ